MPFPANYGGVIDVYYKLFWLKQAGVKIHLHCFTYGRKEAKELEALCEKVYYFKRKTSLFSNLSMLPYTVKSRQSKQLEENLLANDSPILFEVLHTCYLLNDKRFANRKKIYRHSNIEHDYYNELAKAEKSLIKKIFLKIEAQKLKRFEPIIQHANLILAVNQKDTNYFKEKYPSVETQYLPSFHANAKIEIQAGQNDFILFHGNLSISENYEAADWLIDNVFSKLKQKTIIAGLNPPDFLADKIINFNNIQLIKNPSETEMGDLVQNAHVNCLYTKQTTGLKLKLLNVLFTGRFVVCNKNMIAGTNFTANWGMMLSDTFIKEIDDCFEMEFTHILIGERTEMLEAYSNDTNAENVIKTIYNE